MLLVLVGDQRHEHHPIELVACRRGSYRIVWLSLDPPKSWRPILAWPSRQTPHYDEALPSTLGAVGERGSRREGRLWTVW